jgi:dTDP-4-amino-4,6-dideoxygalactose transaminase
MRSRHELAAIGSNQRMTDLQAAIGIPQLARIEAIGERRRANAAALDAALGGSASLRAPSVLPGNRHVYHHYTARVLPGSGLRRDDVAGQLQAQGVETGVFYRRTVFDHDCFRGHPGVAADPCPVAAAVVTQALSLPVHHHLSAGELDQVCTAVAGISA